MTAEDATNMWYSEVKDFDFSNIKYNPNCGHFSQVVWGETKEIGAGRAIAANGMEFIVCRYSPAGNMMNTFQDNVKPFDGNLNDLLNGTKGDQTDNDKEATEEKPLVDEKLLVENNVGMDHTEPFAVSGMYMRMINLF